MAEKAISLPFSIDPYGRVTSTSLQSKIWSDRVKSVLGTFLRERVMRPNFGTLIPYALFETETSAVAQIENEVEKAFNQQLQLLKLQSTTVTFDEYVNVVTVEVTYNLPNNEIESTVVGLVLLQGANPPYQEIS